jgi:hypothetical protein
MQVSYLHNLGQTYYSIGLLIPCGTEHSNIRVFNVHPGMAKSKVLRQELHVFAKDARTSHRRTANDDNEWLIS